MLRVPVHFLTIYSDQYQELKLDAPCLGRVDYFCYRSYLWISCNQVTMVPHPNAGLISYTPELENGKPLFVSSNALSVKASKYEPAGHSFHAAALRLSGYIEKEDPSKSDEKIAPSDREKTFYDSYSSKPRKNPGVGVHKQDHYALLGLAHLRYLATDEQIRRAYRKNAMKYHPDRHTDILLSEAPEAAKKAQIDDMADQFKALGEAYAVLTDPSRRRIYDSTDEFDDEIPADSAPEDFFEVFGPAFMRNGRWSINQPIPLLGDERTPLEEVDKFYSFWYNFKSWREFPHADEHDLEVAESREERRWMERQNAKLTEKARKEDYARIRSLVDNAYKRDPRILKRKEQEKAEKKRKKESKYLAKRLQEEEDAKAAEEERIRKEEEEKRAAEVASQQKKLKEKEKKLARKERSRLRTLAAPLLDLFDISADDVERLCVSLVTEHLSYLCNKIDGEEKAEQARILRIALGHRDDPVAVNGSEGKVLHQNGYANSNGNIHPSSYEKEKPWGKEEIELLRKGVDKYPKETSGRWEVISAYVGTGRSVEEILMAMKTVLLQEPDPDKAFDSVLEKAKPEVCIASLQSTREVEERGSSAEKTTPKADAVKPPPGDPVGKSTSSGSNQDVQSVVLENALVEAMKTFPNETTQWWEQSCSCCPLENGRSMQEEICFPNGELQQQANCGAPSSQVGPFFAETT
ncbi:DnaJ homolog subfamily C member 2-like protein [Drosera capensis]